jgi:hypothetical protein
VGKVVLTKIKADLVDIVFDANGRTAKLVERIRQIQRIDFILALAGSEVSDTDGVSAAGSSAELRRLTPALDADILLSHLQMNKNYQCRQLALHHRWC